MAVPTTTSAEQAVSAPRRTGNRALQWAGPAYAALLVIAFVLFPAPPGGDVSPASDPAWLARHAGAVIAQSYVRGLACVAFAVMGIAVAAVARRRCPAAAAPALVGGALSGGLLLAGQAVGLGAAQYVADPGSAASATRALALLQAGLLDVSALPAALLFLATGLVALRGGGPRWFGWFSLAGAAFAVLDALSYDGGPLAALGIVGLAYFLLWSLLAGFLLR